MAVGSGSGGERERERSWRGRAPTTGQAHAAQCGHNVISRAAQARVVIPRPLNQIFQRRKGDAVEPRAQGCARVGRTENVLDGHVVKRNFSVHHKPEHHRIAVVHQCPRTNVDVCMLVHANLRRCIRSR